ncbi:C4-dicarboxylate transporter/malic acid transport protein-like protein [Pleomassaria siparia CBS 279.74]|uniref:Sulfite efflux pump SSU1 n=1 Tax=Pleomassaria siparia CBS 279.74 TaxID=1314801 RepID=A0A6G1K0J6_9PLEO|nr:C4-dicarboxylate transporter/malic acid transport protein-like protein [Pleomassaria siparia CBS 279.74]
MSRPCSQISGLHSRCSENSPTRQAGVASNIITACPRATVEEKPCANTDDQPLPKWLLQGTGWRRAVQNFTPSWFAVTMGTGIVSILLHTLSTTYTIHQSSLSTLSIVFFALNVLLFTLILSVSILRYTLFPATWTLMIQHPVQSLFLGTLPMGFATIVNMFALVCVPKWGGASVNIAWAMWWIDALVSVTCCFGLPWQMMTTHKNSLSKMTAAWLLPIVAPIVAAASGAIVANILPNANHALWTITTSYVLWGVGVPLALVVLVIYFHKLAVYKLPPQEVIVSVFLPVGPLGQGGFGIMILGKQALKTFPETGTLHPAAGEILYVLGWGVAIVMWGFGLMWLFFAVAAISRSKFPFNMGWWGFTFPLGVFTTSTLMLGEEMPSAFFRVLGTFFAACVMVLWLVVASGTVKNMLYGNLIEAPCLREIEKARQLRVDNELHSGV